jgi:hypothetical protein
MCLHCTTCKCIDSIFHWYGRDAVKGTHLINPCKSSQGRDRMAFEPLAQLGLENCFHQQETQLPHGCTSTWRLQYNDWSADNNNHGNSPVLYRLQTTPPTDNTTYRQHHLQTTPPTDNMLTNPAPRVRPHVPLCACWFCLCHSLLCIIMYLYCTIL